VAFGGDKVRRGPKERGLDQRDASTCRTSRHDRRQDLIAKNQDPFSAQRHTLPENFDPPTLPCRPSIRTDQAQAVKAAEIFKTSATCILDGLLIAAFDTPTTPHGEDGVYSIDTKGLPDGDYEITLAEKLAASPK